MSEDLPEITDPRIFKVVEIINKSFDRKLDFNKLAKEVNLSASRLRHLFKLQIGMSYKQYLRRLKMRRAADLLKTSFLKVREISTRVNIEDVSHFVRDFEKEYGMTPAQYRKNLFKEKKIKKIANNSENGKTG